MPPVKRQPSQGKATSPTRKPGAADHIKRNSMVTNGASDGKLNELSKLNATKVDVQTTKEIREELASAGVDVLAGAELLDMSHKFAEWVSDYRYKMGKDSHGWGNLFRELDVDGSGDVTYDELQRVVRKRLEITPQQLSEHQLKALWCALDPNDSNDCSTDEMAAFLKLAERDTERSGQIYKRQAKNFTAAGAGDTKLRELAELNQQIECQPTTEMRAELEQAGVAFPDDAELLSLSHKFTEWVGEYRYRESKDNHGWASLFREFDEDGSGFITCTMHSHASCAARARVPSPAHALALVVLTVPAPLDSRPSLSDDELLDTVYGKLLIKKKDMPEANLKALWCVLDADDSNQVLADEMARFFKLAERDKDYTGPGARRQDANFTMAARGFEIDKAFKELSKNRALEPPPTKELKQEVEAAGVAIPAGDELKAWAEKLINWIEDYRTDQQLGVSHSWNNLFRTVDEDGSGFVTFDELLRCIRGRLRVRPKMMSDMKVKAVFCALDLDESNQVLADEFAKFLKLGEHVLEERQKAGLTARKWSTSGAGDEKLKELAQMNMGLDCTPTKTLRQELDAKGIELPDEDTLNVLSVKITTCLEDYRLKQRLGDATGYGVLFRTIDEDGSGFVTYDELYNVLRIKLGIRQKTMAEDLIKALWCSLDLDDSNQVMADEMAKFLRRAEKLGVKAPGLKQWKSGPKKSAADDYKELAEAGIKVTPTFEIRQELDALGIELPGDQQLTELAKNLTQWLKDYRQKERLGDGGGGWHILFRTIDRDGSGYVTYDELVDAIRSKLNIKKSVMSENSIKALWCTLDLDNNNQVVAEEMARFLRRAEVKQVRKNVSTIVRPSTREVQRAGAPAAAPAPAPAPAQETPTTRSPAKAKAIYPPLERPLVPPVGKGMPEKPSIVRRRLMAAIFSTDGRSKSPQRQVEAQFLMSDYNAKYKRRMLNEMRQTLLSTPIPEDNGSRIGGGRVLPLYESERLIRKMELRDNTTLAQWQWPNPSVFNKRGMTPSASAVSLSRPSSTYFTEFMGRGDVVPTPSRPKTALEAAFTLQTSASAAAF